MSSKHDKDGISRVRKGHFHRCEWAIYGTTCANINTMVEDLKRELDFSLTYIDADHGKEVHASMGMNEMRVHYSDGFIPNDFDYKFIEDRSDAVLVNGNHYPASRQIVVVDKAKESSLKRREEQLTDIAYVIAEDESEIYPFVRERMTDTTKMITLSDLARYMSEDIKKDIPTLKALILAGGKSSRMGEDKSQLDYHGVSQEAHVARMCKDLGIPTYISKDHNFMESHIHDFPVVKDRVVEMGPIGAIISAFMQEPDTAWLVLASDLPFLTSDAIEYLVRERNTSKLATAYIKSPMDFPEPLVAIYEPRSYARLLSFLSLGYSCPRKVLINSDVKTIIADSKEFLDNVNTPEEMNRAMEKLKS